MICSTLPVFRGGANSPQCRGGAAAFPGALGPTLLLQCPEKGQGVLRDISLIVSLSFEILPLRILSLDFPQFYIGLLF